MAQPSVTDLVKDLRDQEVKTKAWKTKTGQIKGGREFDKNALYKLLNNRMYLGEIFYDGRWHPSIHVAIIDQPLWDSVHDVLLVEWDVLPRTEHHIHEFGITGHLLFVARV